MILIIFTTILIIIAVWTSYRLFQHNQQDVIYFLAGTLIVYTINMSIQHLEIAHELQLTGMSLIASNMISNLFIPLFYLTVCQLCHIHKMSFTTVFLFAVILLNIFAKITVLTDYNPVVHFSDVYGITYYSSGERYFRMQTSELVEILQFMWLFERTLKFLYRTKRDNYQISKAGKIELLTTCLIMIIVIIGKLFAAYESEYVNVTTSMQIASYILISISTLIIGFVSQQLFVADTNNEIVYFGNKPNATLIKRRLNALVQNHKVHRRIGLTIEETAKLLDTNSQALSEVLQTEYDTTFTGYISRARIEDAQNMIKEDPEKPLNEIAQACGFNTPVNFSKAFKKVTGMTAKEWQQTL